MAWIELHQSRQRHPKTLRLAAALGISRREACGLLDDLWTWALDVAKPDGLLQGTITTDIAIALDWPLKQSDKLLESLVRSGYMDTTDDGEYVIHDWYDYAGKLNDRREQNAERMRQKRAKKESVQRTCNAQTSARATNGAQDVRNLCVACAGATNQTNQTNPTEPTKPTLSYTRDAHADTLQAYFSSNLRHMSSGNYDELRQFLADGVSDDLARFAVDTATAAGRQSWGFVRYLLDQWIAADCKTVVDAKGFEQKRLGRKETPNAGHAGGTGDDEPYQALPGEIVL